jgi:2-keto-4-pentenoate hydratase/2-oxohepta-3-ene-1,7-dioic acid hydratase in catechol pathway
MNSVDFNGQRIIPSKIICVGRNYVKHIIELGNEIPDNMVLFMKPNSSITKTLNSFSGETLHYEGEISFMYINGDFKAAAFGLDLTKRKLQSRLKDKRLPWERAKAFDGSVLFSSFVPVDCTIDLSIILKINSKIIQASDEEHMIYKPDEILKEVTNFFTLNDGDIVMTGTPSGVGTISRGDFFEGLILDGNKLLTSAEWTAV